MSWRSGHESGHAPQIARVAHPRGGGERTLDRFIGRRTRFGRAPLGTRWAATALDLSAGEDDRPLPKAGRRCPRRSLDARTIDGVWDVPIFGRGKSQIEHDYQMGSCHRTMCAQRRPQSALGSSRTISSAKSLPTGGSPVSRRDLRLSSHKGASLLFAGRRLRSSSGNSYPSKRRPLLLSINPSGNANERRS